LKPLEVFESIEIIDIFATIQNLKPET